MGWTLFGVKLMQSWAEGVAAVGTASAFLLAAAVFWRAARDRRDDESKQARLIRRSRIADRIVGPTGSLIARTVVLDVTNHSEQPIFDVRLGRVRQGDAWGAEDGASGQLVAEAMSPGGACRAFGRRLDLGGGADESAVTADDFELQFEFTDAHGLRWKRVGDDEPQRVVVRRRH